MKNKIRITEKCLTLKSSLRLALLVKVLSASCADLRVIQSVVKKYQHCALYHPIKLSDLSALIRLEVNLKFFEWSVNISLNFDKFSGIGTAYEGYVKVRCT